MARIQPINIQFSDLTYEVQVGYRGPKKQILKGLNGLFKSGELTAIMGPSGAGKSTLLNILSGFQEGKLTGAVSYVSSYSKSSWNSYKKQSCYIQQTDYLHGMFTVYETMRIAAYLKIDNVTEKYRQMLIENILNAMELYKVKDTRAERLSGGQRKRLSIALELVDNLPVMFLDEPTTGLDSLSSLHCITALQNLAYTGRTVICTIHSPNATLYQMFDHIYLVADGSCMYAGSPHDTIDYFARQGFRCPKYHNPADYILEVINREYGNYDSQLIMAAKSCHRRDTTSDKSRMIREANDDERTKQQLSRPSEMTRFWILLRRFMILLYRDWTTTHMKLFFHFLVAVLVGLIFDHVGDDASKSINNIGFMQTNVLYLSFTSLMPALMQFPLELAILKKERFNNWYQLRTYYAALLISSMPAQITTALIYSIVSFLLTNQPLEWSRYLMFLSIITLTIFTSESLGLGLGTVFDPVNGIFVGSILTAVNLCLAGFFVLFNHMPVVLYYVSYFNYYRYALHGMVQAIYGFGREKLQCPSHIFYCHYRMPSLILEELNMIEPIFWIDIVALLSNYIIIRIITYVGLKRRLSKLC